MESYVFSNETALNTINFFLSLQHRMEEIINFLLEKDLLANSDEYNRFIYNSRKSIGNSDYEEYFAEWSSMMMNLFFIVNEKKSEELKKKA